MRKNKIQPYDLICFFFALCMLFCIGYHVGKPKIDSKTVTFYAIVTASKHVGDAEDEGELFVDGKLPVSVIYSCGDVFIIKMEGEVTAAGFLLEKSKYLSENQPIHIYGERSGIEGKIYRLSPSVQVFAPVISRGCS